MKKIENKDVKEFLENAGIDERELAEVLGLTVGAVLHWTKDRRECPEPIRRLLRLFEETPGDMDYFKQLASDDFDIKY